MSKRTASNIIILLLLVAYIFVYRTVVMTDYLKDSEFITASVMVGIMSISILLLGFRKNKVNMLKKNIRFTTISLVILYFCVTYLIGLIVGFLKNSYSLALPTMINNIFPPFIIIICTEMLRYIFINANKDKKWALILGTFALTMLELSISVKTLVFTDYALLFKSVTLTILPIVSKNVVLSYLTYHEGYQTTLGYTLLMDLYVYIVPIIPDLGEYVNSIIGICLPVLMYVRASQITNEYYNGAEIQIGKRGFNLVDGLSLAGIVIVIGLMSKAFPYYVMGIGSASMSPFIKKGDLVFVEKVDEDSDLEEGDILVFQHRGKTTVHRYVRTEIMDGRIIYKTQGDANNTEDRVDLTIEDIEGKVNFHIPYIAYPSIFLSEALEK